VYILQFELCNAATKVAATILDGNENEAAVVMLLVGKEMKMKILLCMIYVFAFLLQGLSCY
jgi:hypothetical protein